MSTYELGPRLGVTASRVRQLEAAEVDGGIRLSALEKTAEALNCRLTYVLVPKEPLDYMVKRQARGKAREIASLVEAELGDEERALVAEVIAEDLDVLAHRLMDRHGLWLEGPSAVGSSALRALVSERRFPPRQILSKR
jgi:predicted DNA-binding mobile mystery protein A